MRRWQDDPFTKRARRENRIARSSFKLEEIENKEKILAGARLILDLGAAPGSWSQFCLKRCPEARIIAVDPSPMEVHDARLHFFQGLAEDAKLDIVLKDQKADVILSDMAPKTTGVHVTDVARSVALCQFALGLSHTVLKSGGALVVKIFMGEGFTEFRNELQRKFQKVVIVRPESTRKQSREVFLISKGFRPSP